jgi:CAAX amino terminal protease family.
MKERRAERKAFKKKIRGLGLALIFQMVVMVLTVIIFMIVSVARLLVSHPGISEQAFDTQVTALAEQSGIPMIIAVLLGFIPMLIYRRKKFFTLDLKTSGEKITLKVVLLGFACVFGLNMLLTPIYIPVEWLLNHMGFTAAPSEEILNGSQTLSMFLYVGFIAPVFEEFVYRGVVLRSLQPFGKWFAIIGSALLFGMMHGNIVQIPMGFGVGLVLGYLAMKYSIRLTIFLHMANNLFTELFSQIPDNFVSTLIYLVLIVTLIVSVVILFFRKQTQLKIRLKNFRTKLPEKRLWLYFFTSVPFIILLVGDVIQTTLGISRL